MPLASWVYIRRDRSGGWRLVEVRAALQGYAVSPHGHHRLSLPVLQSGFVTWRLSDPWGQESLLTLVPRPHNRAFLPAREVCRRWSYAPARSPARQAAMTSLAEARVTSICDSPASATGMTDAASQANPVVCTEYPSTYCMYRVPMITYGCGSRDACRRRVQSADRGFRQLTAAAVPASGSGRVRRCCRTRRERYGHVTLTPLVHFDVLDRFKCTQLLGKSGNRLGLASPRVRLPLKGR
jgi:hypothetical protein